MSRRRFRNGQTHWHMKKKQRETTIFSLSAIDIFCSAMGVFMILCFIVFPFYRNSNSEQSQTPSSDTVRQLSTSSPLMVAIKWEVGDTSSHSEKAVISCADDYDLHIEAPAPNGQTYHYYFDALTHAPSPARLLIDSEYGGNEVWFHPCATPGEYKISCALYQKDIVPNRGSTLVTLIVMSGDGVVYDNQPLRLSADTPADEGNKLYPLATVRVNPDGKVVVTPTPQ